MGNIKDFDFTIALTPDQNNTNEETRHIKSLLLYADHIYIINPFASIVKVLKDDLSQKDMDALYKSLNSMLWIGSIAAPNEIAKYRKEVRNFKVQLSQPPMRMISIKEKKRFVANIINKLYLMIESFYDKDYISDLEYLIDKDIVRLHDFTDKQISEADEFGKLYFQSLNNALSQHTYPILDNTLYNLIGTIYKSEISDITSIYKASTTHGAFASRTLMQISTFDNIPFDELIDLKAELNGPLTNYRAKMLDYSARIKSAPWEADFQQECSILYAREIAPALQEINEAVQSNSIAKNLFNVMSDDKSLKELAAIVAGGIGMCVASRFDLLSSFTEIASQYSPALLATPAIFKAMQIARQKHDKSKDIKNHDMFFYYEISSRYADHI